MKLNFALTAFVCTISIPGFSATKTIMQAEEILLSGDTIQELVGFVTQQI